MGYIGGGGYSGTWKPKLNGKIKKYDHSVESRRFFPYVHVYSSTYNIRDGTYMYIYSVYYNVVKKNTVLIYVQTHKRAYG